MAVWKRSVVSGQLLNEMDDFVDPNALERLMNSSPAKRLFLKDEFPYLADDEREFLLWNRVRNVELAISNAN